MKIDKKEIEMFFEIFLELCQKRGKSPSAVAKDLKIASGTVTEWKKGRIPQNATLLKLADYFGASVDYLLGKEDADADDVDKTFWKNFSNLCLQKGKTPNAVGAELGCSSTSINSWKKGSIPKWGVLYKMAEYFGVSIKTLLNSAEMDDLPNEPPQKLIDLNSGDVRMIPLFESVSAGFGALAFDDIVDYVPLYIPNQAEADDTICIKVKGNSMSPRIEDGDIVQVRKTQSIDNGSIAVVTVDDEGLLKRVTYGEKWMELRSINPMYKPMRFNSEDLQRVRVVGVVVKIIKHVGGREEIIETIPTDYNEGEQALLELFRSVPEDKRELLMQVIKLTLNKG